MEISQKNILFLVQNYCFCRTETNQDTFNRLLTSSDILISLLRKIKKKIHEKFNKAMKSLILFDDIEDLSSESENETSDESDSEPMDM